MSNDYMEPTTCDWCSKVYELSEGGYTMGDKLCPECVNTMEETRYE